jgi:hypothetical protein
MDESQHLPKGVQIITPERQKMLGMTIEYDAQGLVKYAYANTQKNILRHLHERHIIDDLEYDNGRDYEMWREMFRAFCSNQKMSASYGETRGGNKGGDYSIVLRHLPIKQQQIINYVIDTKCVEYPITHWYDAFQRAFNALGGAMEYARKELDGDIKNQYAAT